MKDLSSIVAKFKVQGTVEEIKPLGAGLINDTYKVKHQGNRCSRLRSTTHQPCHLPECRNASIQYCRSHRTYSQETDRSRRIGY